MRRLKVLWMGMVLISVQFLHGAAQADTKGKEQLESWLSDLKAGGLKIESSAPSSNADSVSVSNLSFRFGPAKTSEDLSPTLRIGKLTFRALEKTDQAVTFASLVAENLSFQLPGSPSRQASMERLELGQASIPATIGFDPDPAQPFTNQIMLLRAFSGATLKSANAVNIGIGTIKLSEMLIADVAAGNIATLELTGIHNTGLENQGQESAKLIRATNLNIDPLVRMFEKSAYLEIGAARPWRKILDELYIESLAITQGATAITVTSGSIGPVVARQFNQDLTSLLDKAALDPAFARDNPGDLQRLTTALRDAFRLEAVRAKGMNLRTPNKAGNFQATLGDVALLGLTFERIDSAVFTKLSVNDPTGFVSADRLAFGDVNLAEVEAGDLVGLPADKDSEPLGVAPLRVGQISTSRLKARVNDAEFSVENAELTMKFFIRAVPTNVSLSVDNFKMDLEDVALVGLRDFLSKLGYSKVDVSARIAGAWDDSASAVAFNTVSVEGTEMGAVSLSGSITGITRESFLNPQVSLPAEMMSAGLQNFRISYIDQSLFERFLVEVSKENSISISDLKRNISANIPQIMKGIESPAIRNKFVFSAISFINDPKILEISSSDKNITPIREVLSMLNEPEKIPGLLKLDASANNRK